MVEDAKYPDFGARVRKAMEQAGMDMEAVAKRLGVGYEMIRRYSHGEAMPRDYRLQQLADILGVSKTWLYAGEGEARPDGTLDDARYGDLVRVVLKIQEELDRRHITLSEAQKVQLVKTICKRKQGTASEEDMAGIISLALDLIVPM